MMPTVKPVLPVLRQARRLVALLGACVLTLSMAAATVQADSYDERRVRTGARLFRGMLAADTALEKHLDADGRLQVLLYTADPKLGSEIAALIAPAAKANLRGMPLQVTASAVLPEAGAVLVSPPAGIFLATRPSDAELEQLIAWGIANHVIVYSPFEGDVERGVTGGLSIEAEVQPYVNLATLRASGVQLKPLFMKVAKVHR